MKCWMRIGSRYTDGAIQNFNVYRDGSMGSLVRLARCPFRVTLVFFNSLYVFWCNGIHGGILGVHDMKKYKVKYSVKGKKTVDESYHGSPDFVTYDASREGKFNITVYKDIPSIEEVEQFARVKIRSDHEYDFDDPIQFAEESIIITPIIMEVSDE